MEAGAFGLSTGLFYLPGLHADTAEVIALVQVVREYGGVHQSHVRDEGDYSIGVVRAVAEVIEIAEATGTTGIVTHMKALGPDAWGLSKACADRINDARGRGVQVFADQYPYDASSTSLAAALLPPWALEGRVDQVRARLVRGRAPDRLLGDVRANLRRRGGAEAVRIAYHAADRGVEGRTIAELAAARGVPPEAVVIDLVARGDASMVSFNMSEDDIEHIMRQPWTMTSSDGSLVFPTEGRPHPRNYAAFTRKLTRYVRERGTIGLEAAVRSMTSLPALVYGLADRGVIRAGAWADLAIFDLDALGERATYDDPHQLSEGMAYVLVNGVVVIRDGQFTDALPGKVLRREPVEVSKGEQEVEGNRERETGHSQSEHIPGSDRPRAVSRERPSRGQHLGTLASAPWHQAPWHQHLAPWHSGTGTLAPWHLGTGTLAPWHRHLGTLAPWHSGTGTLAPWHLGTGTLAPWHPGTLAPSPTPSSTSDLPQVHALDHMIGALLQDQVGT
jgi:N-acyl-D-aspartate/D-glutamate deacylase